MEFPQLINAVEAAQRKSKREKLVINDKYLHTVALKSLLHSGEYETKTREWLKLPEDEQTWEEWKTTFRAAYVAKRQSEAAQEGEENHSEVLHCLERHQSQTKKNRRERHKCRNKCWIR